MSLSTSYSLTKYYSNFFPYEILFALFNRHEPFENLELIYQTENGKFPRCSTIIKNAKTFHKTVTQSIPKRIEVVNYNNCPYPNRYLLGDEFKVESKYLVFDIDIDDYDIVRICECKNDDNKGSYCKKCWFLVTHSAKILALFLETYYGFRNIFCVFSGRRGIHLWVVDKKCLQLTENSRKTLIKNIKSMFLKYPKLKLLSLCKSTIETYFERNENALFSAKFKDAFLSYLSENKIADRVVNVITNCLNLLKDQSDKKRNSIQTKPLQEFEKLCVKKDIDVIHYLFKFICTPRLDENVTQRFYHPIKMPFCIHDKTNNVCHAISCENIQNFYPELSNIIQCNNLIGNDKDTIARFEKSIELIKNTF